jgi:DNA-binding transcriptional ArsR family regulator
MSHRPFKNKLYAEFARLGTALASDKRLELLDLLSQGPRYVDALAAEMEMSVANISQHLQVLRAAKLVEAEREGNRVQYRLTDESVLEL